MRTVRTHRVKSFGSPWDLFRSRPSRVRGILLESARAGSGAGSYSILVEEPAEVLRLDRPQALRCLKERFRRYRARPDGSLPPFAAGAVGYLSYENMEEFEPSVHFEPPAPSDLPMAYFQLHERSVVWDHTRGEMVLCSLERESQRSFAAWERDLRRRASRVKPLVRRALRERSRSLRAEDSMDRAAFVRAVSRLKEHIRRGDIFQANLTHRLGLRLPGSDLPFVYDALRRINPSPFFGYVDAGDFQILSGSPERLLKLEGVDLTTRPIAGTRRRGRTSLEDKRLGSELLLSDKERAEHLMLVDLERNDLGRVCEYGSVTVDELMTIEDYSHVKHIVSNVRGRLRAGLDAFDAMRAFFPGGTITGAPKIRSVRILKEIETVRRGPYTGSLGYFGSTGDMDFNILIRSLFARSERAYCHVGAGIVADSDPDKEYDETLHKARGVLQAVRGARAAGRVPRSSLRV